jgi:hypothetical protein
MDRRLFGVVLVGGWALTACGGSDGGDIGAIQERVGNMMIDSFNESIESGELPGITIDEGCIRDRAGELSDDDAQKILDAGTDGDPDVSPEAEAVGARLIDCIDIDE